MTFLLGQFSQGLIKNPLHRPFLTLGETTLLDTGSVSRIIKKQKSNYDEGREQNRT